MSILRLVAPVAVLMACSPLPAAQLITVELKPATVEAFDGYVRAAEQRQRERSSFLWTFQTDRERRRLRNGEVLVEPAAGKSEMEVPDGLIHDWIGTVFVPGASVDQVMALVQNYDRHSQIYPEVTTSKIVQHNGNAYRIYLRLLKKKVVTVVLNTEHDVRYIPVDAKRWQSRSYSTRIAEVDKPGTPKERELPTGKDHGFLWRLYSYWRFEESDGGVYIECEAISLTRDVPTGFGWLVRPIIRSLPRESLAGTLEATRTALR
ncbi:MAG: hypothetical protein V1798_12220 [Pseudomonadota bacterium]